MKQDDDAPGKKEFGDVGCEGTLETSVSGRIFAAVRLADQTHGHSKVVFWLPGVPVAVAHPLASVFVFDPGIFTASDCAVQKPRIWLDRLNVSSEFNNYARCLRWVAFGFLYP